jgi:hypothetical protein
MWQCGANHHHPAPHCQRMDLLEKVMNLLFFDNKFFVQNKVLDIFRTSASPLSHFDTIILVRTSQF